MRCQVFLHATDVLSNLESEIYPLEILNYKGARQICIIGAGAAGLAALKSITETWQFKEKLWQVVAFETRDDIGGVWYEVAILSIIIVMEFQSHRLPAPPSDIPPLTPMYDSLTTNLPHPVMAYTSLSFPPSTYLYPPASSVLDYLRLYASHFDIKKYIRLNTSVEQLDWDSFKKQWKIKLSTNEVANFELVIIANGHYRVPLYPSLPGLSRWLSSGKASHSAWYRRPHNMGDVVLVVGAGPSGNDIAAEIRTVSRTVIRSVTGGRKEDLDGLKMRGRVLEFKDNGQVVFEHGITESGISHCILATGYELSFPFINSEDLRLNILPSCPPLPDTIFNSKYHIFPLARYIFPLQNKWPSSSMAFIGLFMKAAPFPLIEAQCRAIIKVFENPSSLDITQEAVDIVTRYGRLQALHGDDPLKIARHWHKFDGQEQWEYRDELYKLAETEDSPRVVADWEKEMYNERNRLREIWQELEASGEAGDWVGGVGEGGLQEWVDLMRRMLKRGLREDKFEPRL